MRTTARTDPNPGDATNWTVPSNPLILVAAAPGCHAIAVGQVPRDGPWRAAGVRVIERAHLQGAMGDGLSTIFPTTSPRLVVRLGQARMARGVVGVIQVTGVGRVGSSPTTRLLPFDLDGIRKRETRFDLGGNFPVAGPLALDRTGGLHAAWIGAMFDDPFLRVD